MIGLADGSAVARMLRRVTKDSAKYAEAIICAPFIDADFTQRIAELSAATSRHGCALTVITSIGGATVLYRARWTHSRGCRLVVRRYLHAKAYLMTSRDPRVPSEVLVTSANMTRAAALINAEIGVLAESTSLVGRALHAQVRHSLQRIVTNIDLRTV